MPTPLVIMTGASGAGETTIAQAIEDSHPEITVYQGDRIGLPPKRFWQATGPGTSQAALFRGAFALYWVGVIAYELRMGQPLLLEAQCRIAFLREALSRHDIKHARIILVEFSDTI